MWSIDRIIEFIARKVVVNVGRIAENKKYVF